MADSAYDTTSVYAALEGHSKGVRIVIPPRHDARASGRGTRQRDETIRAINDAGRRQWAHELGYTQGSLVETAMYRYKAIIGRAMRGRTLASQKTEATLACAILNAMTALGMPDGHCSA